MQLQKLIISCCLLLTCQLLQAETKTEYAIDFVVFEDKEARYIGSELWPEADQAQDAAAMTKKSYARKNTGIRAIKTTDYDLLNNEVKRLLNSSRYKVLARKSWLQPGLDNAQAVDIEITPNAQSGSTGSISGSIKIVLERYLHIYTDLVYRRPAPSVATSDDAFNPGVSQSGYRPEAAYVIREHRRMRSRELHYIDHPLVGMLIKIVPVKTEIPDRKKPAAPVTQAR